MLLAAFLQASSAVGAPAKPAEPIALQFGWKPGMECAVRASTSNFAAGTQPTVSTWKFVVSAATGGVRIAAEDYVPGELAESGYWVSLHRELVKIAAESTFVVTHEGVFVGADDVRPVVERMRALRPPAPDDERFDAMMASMEDPEHWNRALRMEWIKIVDAWRTVRLAVGETTTVTAETSLAPATMGLVPDLPMRVTMQSDAPCSDAQKRRCVTLSLNQQPTDAQIQEQIDAVANDPADRAPKIGLRDVVKMTTLEVEPDSLVPHSSGVLVQATVVHDRPDAEEPRTERWHVHTTYRCIGPRAAR